MRNFVLTRLLPPLVLLLVGCSWFQSKDCTVYYRYDGGRTMRPYYAIEVCDSAPPRILCDSPWPLPSGGCK